MTRRGLALLLPALVATAAAVSCESRVTLTQDTHGPEELAATSERTRVRLAWSPVDGAESYEVFQGRDPGVSPEVHTRLLHSTASQMVVQQVIPGTVYYFVVAAIVDGERTETSGEVAISALDDAPLSTTPTWTYAGEAGSRFGAAVASARDVNRDGRGDLVVGSPLWTSTGGDVLGSIDVFLGNEGGLEDQPVFTVAGKQTDAGFGSTVLGVPDLNDDGFDDVLASEPGGFFDDSGRVFAYYGRALGTLEANPVGCFPNGIECAFLFAPDFFANTGTAIDSFADLTGDGRVDLFAGSPFVSATSGGLVELYDTTKFGSVSYPSTFAYRSPDPGDALGSSVASGRDVTGDGIPDAIAGAPMRNGARGRVALFVGSAGTLAGPAWTADSLEDQDELGRFVALADLDCDGRADVVVGVPGADGAGIPDVGEVRVYAGGPPPLTLMQGGVITGLSEGERLGAVAAIGDVDGDGCEDLLVGSPGFDGIFDEEGRAQVYLGGTAGLQSDPIWSDFGRFPLARYGEAVSSAGDVDGDGFRDVVVGAPQFEGTGLVSVYRGLPPSGPRATAGLPSHVRVGAPWAPQLAGFSDPTTAQSFECTWTWGDGEPDTVVFPCTAQSAGGVAHVFAERGRYRVRLSVVRSDAVRGQAITTVHVE